MKVDDLFAASLALLSETPQSARAYTVQKIPLTNQIIAECFEVNNSILESKDLEPLTSIPTITDGTDEIVYDELLARKAMTYGLASLLVLDDDKQKAAAFSQLYDQHREGCKKAVLSTIENVYG